MSKWKPLILGEAAETSRSMARRIADDMARYNQDSDGAVPNPSLCADFALTFAYAAKTLGDRRFAELSERCREQAIDNLGLTRGNISLYGGLTGIGWIERQLDTLAEEGSSADETDEQFEELDQAVIDVLESPSRLYDLIGGTVGFAVYLLERLPSARARGALELLAKRLASFAERVEGGTRWRTPPELLFPTQREEHPHGNYNLGMAHGAPGILVALAEMHVANVAPELTKELLVGGVSWLLAQKYDAGDGTVFFPSWIPADGGTVQRGETTSVRWCYYDLGVGMALLRAGRLMQRPEWIEEARVTLEHCARVENPAASINDAALCHGAFGAAHLFNRAYQALESSVLHEAAQRWYAVGMGMQQPGAQFGGFRAFRPFSLTGEPKPNPWVDEPDFLVGSAGICLALLAASSDIEPQWDHRLLVTM